VSRWIKFSLFLFVVYGIFVGIRQEGRKNDRFAIHKIASKIPNDPAWEVPKESQSLEAIFKQPFFYLGHGLQFYAFESQDKQYVLKFLRHQRLRPRQVFESLPDVWPFQSLKRQKVEECQKRIGYIFRSLIVAYVEVPEETGLLSVHLNKTNQCYPTVQIFDKKKQPYQVLLDSTEFVLQKKATLVKPTLIQLMQKGEVEAAKIRIGQIFRLLQECAMKGVCDTDGQLIRKNNLGFLEDRAIYIDTGKLTRKESIKTKARFAQDLQRLDPLYSWLLEHYPQLAKHFEEEKAKTLDIFKS